MADTCPEVRSRALRIAKKQRQQSIKARFQVLRSKLRRGATYTFDDFEKDVLSFVEGDYHSVVRVTDNQGQPVRCSVALRGFSSALLMNDADTTESTVPTWQQALLAPVHAQQLSPETLS